SYEEFVREYASVGKPVIITDVIKNWKVSTEWTMDFFRSKYGSVKSPVVNYKPGIGYWNQKHKRMKMADYIDYITSDNPDKSLYLSEFNARNHPELLEDCDKVIYFNNDSKNWYRKIPLKYLNRYFGRVSKILIGRKDSTAGLHYDRHCDTAWVAVMSGRKQIVLFSPDQEKYLYVVELTPSIRT
ncbi:MAG: hypothetical protein F6K26_34815, partial [Moorea sp. SIO2I5]|nr:hypothetical protein [Moorena sp. SIO2I5]